MGNTLQTTDSYEVDYSSVPLSADTDSEDDLDNTSNLHRGGKIKLKKISYKDSSNSSVRFCGRKIKLALGISIVGFVTVAIVIAGSNVNSKEQLLKTNTADIWTRSYNVSTDAGACIRLVDIDGDGLQDVLFATGRVIESTKNNEENPSMKEYDLYCSKIGMMPPCYGELIALRGFDGKQLWRIKTKSFILFMNCVDLDVNQDGRLDCIISGRYGLLFALDIQTGTVLWTADQKVVHYEWVVYHAAKVPDVNGDGVPEVIVANGGDIKFKPEDHNRTSGRLMMLSGKTGKLFGKRYLEMLDNRETYMSPMVYKTRDDSHYILFGSGGETIAGNFMMLSLPDFYAYITEVSIDNPAVKFNGKYKQWSQYDKFKEKKTGIYTLYKGQNKGVMVPPVIADVNNDGHLDILMTAFEGEMVLFSGKDLSMVWQRKFPSMETYTSPAPGYFNDDDILDFMIHWSIGTWHEYNETKIFIINGKDGTSLWNLDGKQFVWASDLTLRTTEPNRDLFMFQTVGRESPIWIDGNDNIRGLKRLENKPQEYFDKVDKYIKNCVFNDIKSVNISGPPPRDKEVQHGKPNIPDENTPNLIHLNATMLRLINNSRLVGQGKMNNQSTGPPDQVNKKRKKRHVGMEESPQDISCVNPSGERVEAIFWNKHFKCTDEADPRSEIFIVDRTIANMPIRISNLGFQHFKYRLHPTSEELCAVLENRDLQTAAIGDVDGDGELDLVVKHGMTTELFPTDFQQRRMMSSTTIRTIKLSPFLKSKTFRIPVNATVSIKKTLERDLSDLNTLPPRQQKWTEYMGTKANGYYDLD